MNWFNDKKEVRPPDVKIIREELLQAVKDHLKRAEGGEGENIRGVHLFFFPPPGEQHLYEAAVYYGEDQRFRDEIQRVADDYAIALPEGWTLDVSFTEDPPGEASRLGALHAGLFIRTRQKAIARVATAYLKVLHGEAEKVVYTLQSMSGPVNIGREREVTGSNGFFRINAIAFPAASTHESNAYISRQHAHIRFDHDTGQFFLFADAGGVPPRNKVKILPAGGGDPIKLYSTQVGHPLQEGDQIMLGKSAILLFTYSEET